MNFEFIVSLMEGVIISDMSLSVYSIFDYLLKKGVLLPYFSLGTT